MKFRHWFVGRPLRIWCRLILGLPHVGRGPRGDLLMAVAERPPCRADGGAGALLLVRQDLGKRTERVERRRRVSARGEGKRVLGEGETQGALWAEGLGC